MAAEQFGLAARRSRQNWFTSEDVRNRLYPTGWEVIRESREIPFPFPPPLLGPLLNRTFSSRGPRRGSRPIPKRCGAKVISRWQYQLPAANRRYFGEFDPFGDFDPIFGAARFSLKIVDLPVRYGECTFGKRTFAAGATAGC